MLSPVRVSSVLFVHPTQPVEIFGNVSTPFSTLATCLDRRREPLSVGGRGLNTRGVAKYSDFGPIEGYISETVHAVFAQLTTEHAYTLQWGTLPLKLVPSH